MVYEAGLISFLRTVLIIGIVFYGFRLLVRVLIPYLLKRFVQKQQRAYQNQANNYQQTNRKEGEVHIKSQKESTRKNDNLGDYVEYEDVEEQDQNKS